MMISAWGVEHGEDVSKGLGSALKGVRAGQLSRAKTRGYNKGWSEGTTRTQGYDRGKQVGVRRGVAVTPGARRSQTEGYRSGFGAGARKGQVESDRLGSYPKTNW